MAWSFYKLEDFRFVNAVLTLITNGDLIVTVNNWIHGDENRLLIKIRQILFEVNDDT